MRLYEIGLAICGVLGVAYGVGLGVAYDRNPGNPRLRRAMTVGALVLGVIFVVTVILFFLRK